jgi:hypothetical protein
MQWTPRGAPLTAADPHENAKRQFGVDVSAIAPFVPVRCCIIPRLLSGLPFAGYERGGTRWQRFQEKRGKEHEIPVHSKAKEAVDLWLERSYLASNSSAPLFPSIAARIVKH